MSGWGTDEKAVIQVLGHRNATQRKIIRDTYQKLYNQSLIDSLDSELSGDFGVCSFLHFNILKSQTCTLSSERRNTHIYNNVKI